MAYTRKYGKKYSKRPRRTSAMDKRIAKVARKTIYQVAEKKCIITVEDEVQLDSLVQGATANWTPLADLGTALGPAGRIGAEVRFHSVRCRGLLHNNQTSGSNVVRMVIGYLLNQTAPSPSTDIFLSASNLGAAVSFSGSGIPGLNAIFQPLNPVTFQPLVDRVFKLGGTSSLDGTDSVPYDFTINLKNKKIKAEGNSSGVGNYFPQLYMCLWHAETNDDIGTGTIVEWSGMQQLFFTDV